MLFRQSRQLMKFMSDATRELVGSGVPAESYPEIVRRLHEEMRRHTELPALSGMDEEQLFHMADHYVRSKMRLTTDGLIRIDDGPSERT